MDESEMLVSDYDQTFYLNDKDIIENINAVREFREKGNIFVIATGRSYLDLQKKVNMYNIEYDYALINHGATIIDNKGNVLNNFSIKKEIKEKIKDDLELERAENYFCCSELQSRVDFDYPNLNKIAITYQNGVNVKNISDKLNFKYKDINVYLISKYMLEIISRDTDKANSIKLLSNYLKFDLENIYTIGDGYSDIYMVRDYKGYAIKDAKKELKKVAIEVYNLILNTFFKKSLILSRFMA